MASANRIPHEFRLVRPPTSGRREQTSSQSGPPSLVSSSSSNSSLSTLSRSFASLNSFSSLPEKTPNKLRRQSVQSYSTSALSSSLNAGRRTTRRRNSDPPGVNLNLCFAQRSGASSVREIISRVENHMVAFVSPEQSTDNEEHISALLEDCAALAELTSDPYYRVVVATNGGMLAIVDVMKWFREHKDIQEVCCIAMSKLSKNNPRAFEKAGGLDVVTSAMRMHPLSSSVQTSSCDVLRNFVSNDTSHFELLKKQSCVSTLIQSALDRGLLDDNRESAEYLLERL